MSVREQVQEILKQIKPTKNLDDVKDIIEGGYIDSFELMLLITTLSEKFGAEISLDEMVPENFNSVDAIAEMIERLLKK